MEDIKEGDIVYLKSEELLTFSSRTYMTTGEYGTSKSVRICYWFVNGEIKSAAIPLAALAVSK
ncbi:MAG: hypothetical protein ACK5KT_14315 [Dysgonomonas sp.]